MVYFTCNNCGTTLKKNQVERHMMSCGKVVSCIDCLKDFRGQEFQSHTKCISEAEKYNGKDWKAPSSQNKGERKQLAWVETVNTALEKGRQSMTPAQIALMKVISKHENVPRKKAKFMNFIKNVSRNQFDMRTIEAVWDCIEGEWKRQAEQNKSEQQQESSEADANGEKSNGTEENGHAETNGQDEESKPSKKDKKKRKRENDQNDEAEAVNGDVKKKKKKGNKNEDEEPQDENNESVTEDSTGEFRWGEIIQQILMSREDNSITMKKLKKKVFSEYYLRVGDSKGVKTKEDLSAQLNKKLKKKKFQVVGETVKLAINNCE